MNDALNKITKQLTTINRGGTNYGKAYNKPIFLLSLIDFIEYHKLKENRVLIDDSLFDFFKRNWKLLVPNIKAGSVLRPVYHLQRDELWKVITKEGYQQSVFISSKKELFQQTAYGELDD